MIFNDPVPVGAPVRVALEMALAMRARLRQLLRDWRYQGYELGFGIGMDFGYATLGIVGHEGRYDHTRERSYGEPRGAALRRRRR